MAFRLLDEEEQKALNSLNQSPFTPILGQPQAPAEAPIPISAPQPAEPSDAELEAAQRARYLSQLGSSLAETGARIGGVFARQTTPFDATPFDKARSMGELPLTELKEKREAATKREESLLKKEDILGKKAERVEKVKKMEQELDQKRLGDIVESPQVIAARSIFPGIPKNVSYNQIKDILPQALKLKIAETMEAGRESREARREEARTEREKTKAEKLPNAKLTTLEDFDKAAEYLNSMAKDFKGSYVGMLEGRMPDFASSAEKNAFRSTVKQFFDKYRHAITGAGASVKELSELEKSVPNVNDNDATFLAKVRATAKLMESTRQNFLNRMEKAGYNVERHREPIFNITPSKNEISSSPAKTVPTTAEAARSGAREYLKTLQSEKKASGAR